MFLDLNIPLATYDRQSRREIVATAILLGYDGTAANHLVSGLLGNQDACGLEALDLQSLFTAAEGAAQGARYHQKLVWVPGPRGFKQLTRLTILTDSTNNAAVLTPKNPILVGYDIVAVQPMSQAVFAQACSTLAVDIISLDMSNRLPFRLRAPMVAQAIARGVHFEISYSCALRDATARRHLFSNARALITATRGRNILITSGALVRQELRAPLDVANMASLFGFAFERARVALTDSPRAVILHGQSRKLSQKIAVQIIPTQTPQPQPLPSASTWDPSYWPSSLPLDMDSSVVRKALKNDADKSRRDSSQSPHQVQGLSAPFGGPKSSIRRMPVSSGSGGSTPKPDSRSGPNRIRGTVVDQQQVSAREGATGGAASGDFIPMSTDGENWTTVRRPAKQKPKAKHGRGTGHQGLSVGNRALKRGNTGRRQEAVGDSSISQGRSWK